MQVVTIWLFAVLLSFGQLNEAADWLPPEFMEIYKPVSGKCKSETGVSEAAIKQFNDDGIHEDPALKCYMFCLSHEFHAVDNNGDPDFAHIDTHLKLLDEEIREISRQALKAYKVTNVNEHFPFINVGRASNLSITSWLELGMDIFQLNSSVDFKCN